MWCDLFYVDGGETVNAQGREDRMINSSLISFLEFTWARVSRDEEFQGVVHSNGQQRCVVVREDESTAGQWSHAFRIGVEG